MESKKYTKIVGLIAILILLGGLVVAYALGGISSFSHNRDLGDNNVFNTNAYDMPPHLNEGIKPIPYVGAAHETQRIVNTMPLPRGDMTVYSIQIGADHGGFGYGAYTLTVHYNLHSSNLEDAPGAEFEQIALRLFELIENLQAVTFSIVSPEDADGEIDEEIDMDNYIYRWSISRTSSETDGGAITSFRGIFTGE